MTNPLLSCPGSESPSLWHISICTRGHDTNIFIGGGCSEEGRYNYIGNGLLPLFALRSVSGFVGLLFRTEHIPMDMWQDGWNGGWIFPRDVLVYNSTERDHRHLPWMGQCVLYFNNKDVILSDKLLPVMLHYPRVGWVALTPDGNVMDLTKDIVRGSNGESLINEVVIGWDKSKTIRGITPIIFN